VVPTVPTTPVKPEDGKKKSTMENVAPATIVVTVPADARLTIDGEATTSTSTRRVFVSPALEAGRDYHYTLKAEFVKDGKPVTVSKEIAVQAGNETRVTLDAGSLAGVASR
jgi:uncharacterized protein (TIGR03000 family)